MDDLTAFVRARLDEDEAIAQGAARTDDGHDGRWLPFCFRAGGFDARVDDHLARHDPARVLREVQAGREILTAYVKIEADGFRDNGWIAFRFAVETLAEVWSDHPEYRPEWKP